MYPDPGPPVAPVVNPHKKSSRDLWVGPSDAAWVKDQIVRCKIPFELCQVPSIEIPRVLEHARAHLPCGQDRNYLTGLPKHEMPFPQQIHKGGGRTVKGELL